jgi:hypothetical protein
VRAVSPSRAVLNILRSSGVAAFALLETQGQPAAEVLAFFAANSESRAGPSRGCD